MRKVILVLFCFLFIAGIFAETHKSSGPPGCYAGEPPLAQNCIACHGDSPLNSGSALIDFSSGGADSVYNPGNTYTFDIAVKNQGILAAGFQFLALEDGNSLESPGQILLSDAARTQKVDSANPHVTNCALARKVWVEHKFQGIFPSATNEVRWSFQWKAPDSSVGPITFYLSALEANLNQEETGDHVYVRTIHSLAGPVSREKEVNTSEVKVYPSVGTGWIQVADPKKEIRAVEVMDFSGKILLSFQGEFPMNSGSGFDLSSVGKGIRFVAIKTESGSLVRKILIF